MSRPVARARRRWAGVQLCAVLLAAMLAAGCLGGGASPGQPTRTLAIAGGGTTGVYYAYGSALAKVMSDQLDASVDVVETGGSVENLRRVASGSSVLGFTAADAAADAVAGRAPFVRPQPIRGVARLYDDFVHLVVPADSDVYGLTELRGRRVSLGAVGSGTDVIARRLLAAADVDESELATVSKGIDASIDAMRSGDIDAFFWSGGLPTPGVSQLSSAMPIRLVELDEYVDAVSRAHDGVYRHAVVPAGAYGAEDPVATMAVPNYLVARTEVDDDLIAETTRMLFEQRVELARDVPAAALLDRRRAIFTEPVELHEAAMEYYRATKP